MAKKEYDWSNGLATIQPHSIAKHTVLKEYLAKYFETLSANHNREELKISLVDGFSGGGAYYLNGSNEIIKGSPFILLDAVSTAEFNLNKERTKKLKIDANFHFIEKNRSAFLHLKDQLVKEGYAHQFNKKIILHHCDFNEIALETIKNIKKHTPRNGRSIFVLDQYGYTDVSTSLLKTIFQHLPSAEIILTFAVDALINFLNEEIAKNTIQKKTGIRINTNQFIDLPPESKRLMIQKVLYSELTHRSSAKHFTPFFIRNSEGHGDYWLVHLSQHHKAKDVMTEVHWSIENHFIHHGDTGLDMLQMLGYDPRHDAEIIKQNDFFGFDSIAKEKTIEKLMEHLPHVINSNDDGFSFGELFATTCNHSPATMSHYQKALASLVEHKEIEIETEEGGKRRSAGSMKRSDIIKPSKQFNLF